MQLQALHCNSPENAIHAPRYACAVLQHCSSVPEMNTVSAMRVFELFAEETLPLGKRLASNSVLLHNTERLQHGCLGCNTTLPMPYYVY